MPRACFVTGRAALVFVALSFGACVGSSHDKNEDSDDSECRLDVDCPPGRVCVDLDGNLNDTCEGNETCECALVAPGSGGVAGAGAGGMGAGGTSGIGGTNATGGSAGTSAGQVCKRDQDCPEPQFCIDIVGDGDDFCESGEKCMCESVGGTGGSGSGGASGTGGAAGKGGGGSGGTPTTGLGAPCTTAADCGGEPLICLTSSGLADRSGPPGGLCTLPCTADDECLELSALAYCVGFDSTTSYCIQGCRGGSAGAPKCHERADFACGILDATPTTVPCIDNGDCSVGQVCFEDVCQTMVTACRPTCEGDFDCASGQFCDFVSGFCVPARPTGLPIGSLCDPTLPTESDPCNGFCLETADGTQGTCAAFCSANADAHGCGWNGNGAASAGCLYATVISSTGSGSIDLAPSDLMLCGKLCNCNADCPATNDRCIDENAGDPVASIQALFGRSGYCRPLMDTETEADTLRSCTLAVTLGE